MSFELSSFVSKMHTSQFLFVFCCCCFFFVGYLQGDVEASYNRLIVIKNSEYNVANKTTEHIDE